MKSPYVLIYCISSSTQMSATKSKMDFKSLRSLGISDQSPQVFDRLHSSTKRALGFLNIFLNGVDADF